MPTNQRHVGHNLRFHSLESGPTQLESGVAYGVHQLIDQSKISLLQQQSVLNHVQWGVSLTEQVDGAQGGRIHGATIVLFLSS
uniref:Uncharacterized protein n=1 Tax=Timema shepardi TaxID=629360 RepID=A0A7R9BAS4_TIMSH|nr:unnamed protein product [Timema shepardi]